METPILGRMNKSALRNMRLSNAEKNKEDRKEKKRILNRLEDKFLPLPTIQLYEEDDDGITLSDFEEDREVLRCYEFTPTDLTYLKGFLIFYYDGTSEVVIRAYSWEDLSRPLMREIQRWEFFNSPFKIKDEKYNYPFFFSQKGTSVGLEKTESFEEGFKLVSDYFYWIYKHKIPQEYKLFSDYRITVENFLVP